MSKYNHQFKLKSKTDNTRIYSSDSSFAQIDFISKSAIRVAIYKDEKEILPTFCVNPNNEISNTGRNRLSLDGFELSSPEVTKAENQEVFELQNGITITLNLHNFLLKYSNGNSTLFKDRTPVAYNFNKEFGNGNIHYVSREDNETIYGLGDKGGSLDKSGRAFRIETADSMGYSAKSTDILYKHIPFYICENTAGSYGIFYDTSDTSYMDCGNEINNYYEPYKYFKTEDNALVYYVFFGTKLDILKQFSKLCGTLAFPPKWSFDYCASTMAYTDAPKSEEKMNGFLQKLKDIDLSCKGFYLSSGYTSIGDQRFVFNWNYDKFPSPKDFIKHFSDSGIEIIPNIKPAFLEEHPMYKEIAEKGYFVKNPDGTPFITQFWDGNGSYIDFTNKDAYDFWGKQVTEKLLDYGIKATWNDNNEFDIKDIDALSSGFGDGNVKASRIRSILTYLMVQSSYEAQTKKYPKIRPFLSTRSGNIGVRRYAQTWSGDNNTSFEDLKYCHFIGLTLSMSGMYFYGHDLGGFSGNMPSRELLLRWIQHGIFEPRFTIHSWNKDGSATMPWSYPDIIDSVKAIFAQRKQFVPYLYSSAYKAVEENIPLNAPLNLYYDDKNIDISSNSFMFGRDILTSFIFDEGIETVDVYLPNGDNWYLDGKLYKGGQKVTLSIPATSKMPYFVRSGSVLPTDENDYGFGKDEKLVFTIYPIESGTFESEFFTDDGVSYEYKNNNCVKLKFTVKCDSENVTVQYSNYGNMDIKPNIRLSSQDKRNLIIER